VPLLAVIPAAADAVAAVVAALFTTATLHATSKMVLQFPPPPWRLLALLALVLVLPCTVSQRQSLALDVTPVSGRVKARTTVISHHVEEPPIQPPVTGPPTADPHRSGPYQTEATGPARWNGYWNNTPSSVPSNKAVGGPLLGNGATGAVWGQGVVNGMTATTMYEIAADNLRCSQ